MNHSEHTARRLKSQRLARAIRALNMGLTAEDVAAFPLFKGKKEPSDIWANLAELATELELRAGTIDEDEVVHPPHSKETVEAVCSELRRLESDATIDDLISGPASGTQARAVS